MPRDAEEGPGGDARDLGLAFAGGGNRAFYQLGLMNRWGDRLRPRVAAVAACSAGACVALMWLTGRRAEARAVFQARTKGITRNLDWRRPLRGEPLAPHGRIYRELLTTLLEGGGLERVRQQPFPVLVLASGFPRRLPASLAVVAGIAAYQTEKALRPRMVHPAFGRRLGFTPVVADARACDTAGDLVDLILASSATPPFTPLGRFRGQPLLDGGMVDNVPAFVTERVAGVRRTLVLLSRPYPGAVVGPQGTRFYVAPTRPVPVDRWDYTRPQRLEDTVDMGEREADVHGRDIEAWLGGWRSYASSTAARPSTPETRGQSASG
jgi:predicted acylesterase/phospholipase RssA